MAEIRGVNLGGWFVLEYWMKPELFDNEKLKGVDETAFVKNLSAPKEKLEEHWQTFIKESDFAYLSESGINSIRLPIPWWMFGASPYVRSVEYIDKAMEWAKKYHLQVLLDLHTAPGSQNGFDNGGIYGVCEWSAHPENIELTVSILGQIAARYSENQALWGIEVLNEPHWTTDLTVLTDFYKKAYTEIRKYLPDRYVVFHDSFRPLDDIWPEFFAGTDFKNVAFDIHLYQCFDPKFSDFSIGSHIGYIAEERLNLLEKLQKFTKVIVGEWSLGLPGHAIKSMDSFNHDLILDVLTNVQLLIYEKAFGYYFWSYHIMRESHLEWDFKRLREKGLFAYLNKNIE